MNYTLKFTPTEKGLIARLPIKKFKKNENNELVPYLIEDDSKGKIVFPDNRSKDAMLMVPGIWEIIIKDEKEKFCTCVPVRQISTPNSLENFIKETPVSVKKVKSKGKYLSNWEGRKWQPAPKKSASLNPVRSMLMPKLRRLKTNGLTNG